MSSCMVDIAEFRMWPTVALIQVGGGKTVIAQRSVNRNSIKRITKFRRMLPGRVGEETAFSWLKRGVVILTQKLRPTVAQVCDFKPRTWRVHYVLAFLVERAENGNAV